MKHHEEPETSFPAPSKKTGRRRPYTKPRVIHQEALEAVAADCSVAGGKGDPTCIVGFS